MVNRGGFLKVLEASVAIVIVLGFLFVNFVNSRGESVIDYNKRAGEILEEISLDNEMREDIIQDSFNCAEQIPDSVLQFIEERIPENFLDFEVRICEPSGVCGICEIVGGDVFTGERIVSATLESGASKKIKLFVWKTDL